MTKDSNLDIIEKWRNAIRDTPSIKNKIQQSGAKSEKEYYEQYATEQEFLNWYHQQEHNNYPKPSLTVDLIGLRWNSHNKTVQILLVQRKNHPFKDHWALPGGFIQENESINDAISNSYLAAKNCNITSRNACPWVPYLLLTHFCTYIQSHTTTWNGMSITIEFSIHGSLCVLLVWHRQSC